MEILKKDNYRIQTISKVIIDDKLSVTIQQLPLSEGLNIEKQCSGSLSGASAYYVIATVSPDKDNGIDINVCGDRILDVETHEWALFKQLCQIAIDLVKTQNMTF